MPSIAFALPVRDAGNEREFLAALTGEQGRGVHGAHREHGFRRIKVWRQEGPQAMDIVYLEADDLEAAMSAKAGAGDEHSTWLSSMVEGVTGHKPGAATRPKTRLLVDWHESKGHSTEHHD